MITLRPKDSVGKYTVQYFIKEGLYDSTYKVTDESGSTFFMKLYDPSLVPAGLLDDGVPTEIIALRKISHPNLISYVADGTLKIDGSECWYLVTDYFMGSLLSDSLNSGKTYTEETVRSIMAKVLDGLDYLSGAQDLCHNDITPRNIILDVVEKDGVMPRIIDFGHVHEPFSGAAPFPVDDLTLHYCAPEVLSGFYYPKGDAFAVAAVMYHMLTGAVPWPCDLNENDSFQTKKTKIRAARKKPLDVALLESNGVSEKMVSVIVRGLEIDSSSRPDVHELSGWLRLGEEPPKMKRDRGESAPSAREQQTPSQEPADKMTVSVEFRKNEDEGKGGFADVAGMDHLKDELQKRVIWVLKDREKAEKYRLTPPNGMLLYGPPGCGKTFFAEKFAEESHFNFTLVNGSDLGSSYMHGTQNKIADLFKKAEKNAPCILCFDEFDSFVPSRSSRAAEQRSEEVNEFLSQLNNCAKKGIFVIGTTNRIDMIDSAVLRKGRMDLHVEVPAPDLQTRESIFRIHLKGRPLAGDINYAELAEQTDNYASSDIAFIVNEAAMMAALADSQICHQNLMNSIKSNPSSLGSPAEERRKIGFK